MHYITNYCSLIGSSEHLTKMWIVSKSKKKLWVININVFKDMKPRMSPLSVRSSKVQDTNFTTTDTEEAVAKISALFPTVSETHIKLLLKK